MNHYAKAIIAILGAAVTSALTLVGPEDQLFKILTVAAAVLTAAGVYLVPNGSTEDATDDSSDAPRHLEE